MRCCSIPAGPPSNPLKELDITVFGMMSVLAAFVLSQNDANAQENGTVCFWE